MALPVTVYRWDDPGAPQLNLNNGSMVNLLRKCLVDGYGDKTPAGWVASELSVDGNNMILSPASSGWHYVIYDDARNTYLSTKGAMIGAIDAWTDIENVLSTLHYEPWESRPALNSASNQWLDKTRTQWCVVATSNTFYLLQDGGYPSCCVVGKLDVGDFDQSYTCICLSPRWTGTDSLQFLSHRVGEFYLEIKTQIPVSSDPNTGSHTLVKSTYPNKPYNYSTANQALKWHVWSDIVLASSTNKIVGRLPFMQVPHAYYDAAIGNFHFDGSHLYFNRCRWEVLQ